MTRTRIDLTGEWAFHYAAELDGAAPSAVPCDARMPVPGCWDDHHKTLAAAGMLTHARYSETYQPIRFPMTDAPPDATLPHLIGVVYYRREITIPSDADGRQVYLVLPQAVMETTVCIDDRPVGRYDTLSAAHRINITQWLSAGQSHQLALLVDNRRCDQHGCRVRGYKGRSGGLFGDVAIEIAGTSAVTDLHVHPIETPSGTRLRWRAALEGALAGDASVQWAIHDPAAGQTLAGGQYPVDCPAPTWETDTAGMMRWSDVTPKRYELRVSVHANGQPVDTHCQPFGLRTVQPHHDRIQLNGAPVYLRGVTEHAYFAETCTPPTDHASYQRYTQRLKQLGMNWLRFHTWTPPHAFLDATDEAGVLVQVEPPINMTRQGWRDIINHCRSHPSVILLCPGNEELCDESRIDTLRQRAADCAELAPDVLFSPQEGLRGVEYGWSPGDLGDAAAPWPEEDADGFKPMTLTHVNTERLDRLRAFADVLEPYTWGQLSYMSAQGDAAHIDSRLRHYLRPCLAHELGIHGTFINLDLEHRYAHTRIGPDLYSEARRHLRAQGVEHRAATYYAHSCAWARRLRKHAIETARRCQTLTGYDLLGAIDHHWHRTGYGCGIMNEFFELKAGDSLDEISQYNAQSVLLHSHASTRNLRMGDRFACDVALSWFEGNPLEAGVLRWWVVDDHDRALVEGEPAPVTAMPGRVTPIGRIEFTVPRCAAPTRAQVRVELETVGGRWRNAWDYWLFPDAPVPSSMASVHVLTEPGSALDEQTIAALRRGERVVLFASGPFPALPSTFQIASAGRNDGHLATVIEDHPALGAMPHEGFCDWQFAPMLEAGASLLLPDKAVGGTVIELVPSYKWFRRQAAVVACRVGAGGLVVCGLRLPADDPGAQYLRTELLRYAAESDFAAAPALSEADVRAWAAAPPASVASVAGPADAAFDPRAQPVRD